MKRLLVAIIGLSGLIGLTPSAFAGLACSSCAYITAGPQVDAWEPVSNTLTTVATFPSAIDSLVFDKNANIIASADSTGRALYEYDSTSKSYSTLVSNLGTYLGDLALEPAGSAVLVADRGSASVKGAILRIDLNTLQVTNYYNGGMYPGGIIFDNNGNFFAVLGPATNSGSIVAQIDPVAGIVKQIAIPNGGDGMTFSTTTLRLYVGSQGGFYSIPTDLSAANFVSVSGVSSVDGVGTASHYVYMVHYNGNGYQYDLNSGQITATSKQVNNIDDIAPLSGFGSLNPPPGITFTANPNLITAGSQSTLGWTIQNATSAMISPTVGTISPTTGSSPVTPAVTTTYTLTAWGLGGSASRQVTVTVSGTPPPVCGDGTCNGTETCTSCAQDCGVCPPAPVLNSISPNTTSAGSPAFTLTANGSQFVSGAAVIWNGSPRPTTFINTNQLQAGISAADVASAGSATVLVANPDLQSSGVLPFTITSGNGGGNPPTISLSANPGTITSGGSSTLNWTISNATSAVLDQGIGAISPTSGSTSVSPANTRTYTLTAWGNGGRSTAQVTVTVKSVSGGPIPTITFQASPASILTGGNSTLSWTIANATSAVIDQNIGSISPTSGTQLVSPGTTVTYTLIAWGPGGSNIAQVTVTVNPIGGGGQPPSIVFSANPTTISAGNSSTLNWTISNATSAVIDQNIGAVSSTSGSKAVSPANTTTFTLTACGNGCVTALVTVTVNTNGGGGNNPPAISFTANPTSLTLGDSSLLTWTISNATSAVIDTGIGPITVTSGSRLVTPIATRTFTLTAWGLGGSRTAQVTLTVTGTGNPSGAGSTDLSQAKAYPVPYKARESKIGGILFNGLSTGARIRIFTTDGHLVQTLYADDKILWTVTNKNDEKVSSGVYFYRIDNGAGQVKEGKLVIIQ